MSLVLCRRCQQHHIRNSSCPHCSIEQPRKSSIALSLFLGLGLAACGNKTADTADTADTAEDTAEIAPEPSSEEDYGVPETINTGELWVDDE